MTWLNKLKSKLNKTATSIGGAIAAITSSKLIDKKEITNFEELLILSDIDVRTAAQIARKLEKIKKDEETSLNVLVCNIVYEILSKAEKNSFNFSNKKLNVIMLCGVNGNGKTTTVAKLAAKYQRQGLKVMLAGCDTFRAAAVEQLEHWAISLNIPICTGSKKDPASVAYNALEVAAKEGVDVLIIDTAGRLHNNQNLMDELGKINKVVMKFSSILGLYYKILVIDGTAGNNALSQAKIFDEKISIDGFIISKLDGSAKGGVAISLVHNYAKPIYFIGLGEGVDDLYEFDAKTFAESICMN